MLKAFALVIIRDTASIKVSRCTFCDCKFHYVFLIHSGYVQLLLMQFTCSMVHHVIKSVKQGGVLPILVRLYIILCFIYVNIYHKNT